MNHWTQLSVDYANQRSYLDDLFSVYPTIPEGIRDLDKGLWSVVEKSFQARDDISLINALLDLDLFPIKDSYVAYLRKDAGSLKRNPKTIQRICGRLYELGLDKIHERATEPKETNRQIGPLFRNWLRKKTIGAPILPAQEFVKESGNAILDGSDDALMSFARRELGYSRNKGLDFIGKFNGKYVIGEAKFLTDWGGHQNAQLADAISTMSDSTSKAVKIAILDGVVYIPGKNKMYETATADNEHGVVLSALVLREFLYSL